MSSAQGHPLAASLQEYGRGVIGGLIFSLPLIFTMEVWWAGFSASPGRLLLGLAGTFLLLLAYNEVAGIREDHGPLEVVIDSIEELGLGLLLAFLTLLLLDRINFSMPLRELTGKVVVEGLIIAIGVSIGTAQLGGASGANQGDAASTRAGRPSGGRTDRPRKRHGAVNIVVLSLCGAVVIASSIAPTDEVMILGQEMSPVRLLWTMVLSLGLAALTLFFSEFIGSHDLTAPEQRSVLFECVIAYAVALACSASILWFFGRFGGDSSGVVVGQVVVLALPATVGAAAGRLLLQ
jgi:putative integral membrane protein (TIGR02587 family)